MNEDPKAVRPLWVRTVAHLLSKLFPFLPPLTIEEFLERLRLSFQGGDPGRRRGRQSFLIVAVVLALLIYWFELREPVADRKKVNSLIKLGCWVTYDPVSFNPYSAPNPHLSRMRRDLRMIHGAGFTGVVTFGGRGTLAEIPRLAKEEQLAVIMGVWSPGDSEELKRAILQAPFVDAYCIGHNGLNRPEGYTFEELEKSVRLVQRGTGKPVATTEEARFYQDHRLASLGDWLFPDVHLSLIDRLSSTPRVDLKRDLAAQLAAAQVLARLARETGRPLLLKMLSYPWSGAEGASLGKQKEFFASSLEAFRSPDQGLEVPVGVVVHSAFDIPWKKGYPFYSWDAYTGVLAGC